MGKKFISSQWKLHKNHSKSSNKGYFLEADKVE